MMARPTVATTVALLEAFCRYSLLGTREGRTQEHVRMQPNHVYVSKQPVPHEKVGCPSRNMAFCTRYSYSLLIVACLETSILLAPAAFPGVATSCF